MRSQHRPDIRPSLSDDAAITHMIPTLHDRQEESSALQNPKNRSNPFLPYETLERLAEEREIFKAQLATLGHPFIEQPQKMETSEHRLEKQTKTGEIETLIRSITQDVMDEYRNEIEMEVLRRIKTRLMVD